MIADTAGQWVEIVYEGELGITDTTERLVTYCYSASGEIKITTKDGEELMFRTPRAKIRTIKRRK